MKKIIILFVSLLMVSFVSADSFERVDTNLVNATRNVTIGTGDTTFLFNGSNGDLWMLGRINQTLTGGANRLGLTYMRGAKIRSIGGDGYYTLGALDDAGLLYFENAVDHSGKLVYMVFNLTTESIQIQNPLSIDITDLGLDPDDPVIEIQDGSTSAIFTASQVTVDNADIGGIINGSPTIVFDNGQTTNPSFIRVGDSSRTISGTAQYSDGLCGDIDRLYGLATSFTTDVMVGDVLTLGSQDFGVLEIISDTILEHDNPTFGFDACTYLPISLSNWGAQFEITTEGYVASDLLPNKTSTFNLGSDSRKWDTVYASYYYDLLPLTGTTDIGSSSSPFWISYTESVRALDSLCLDSSCIFSWDDVNKSDFGNISVEGIQYNITPSCDTDDAPEGFTCWNSDDMTLNIVTGLGNVQQVGQEVYGIGINKGSYALSDGSVVALSGSQGDRFTFIPADSSSALTSSFVGVLTTTCEVNAECPVTVFGQVRGIDTSAWSVNDSLYMNPSEAGNMTNTPPSLPNNPLWVASVIVSHPTQGVIGLVLRNDPNDGFLANDGWFTGEVNVEDTLSVNYSGDPALNGVLRVRGDMDSNFGSLMVFNPELSGTNWVAFRVAPTLNVSGAMQLFRFSPSYTSDSDHKATMLIFEPPNHVNDLNDDFRIYEEAGVDRQHFQFSGGDTSVVNHKWFVMGGQVDFADSSLPNTNYTEDMITLKGGGNRLFGTNGFINQRGLVFEGFGTQTNLQTKDFIRAIDSDGGIFEWGDLGTSLFNVTATTLVDLPHVEVYNVTENGYTLSIPSLNTWYNFTGLQMGETNEFTISGNDLTANYGGVYKVDYSVSFSGSGGSTHSIGLLINNVEHEPCRVYRKLGTAGDVGNAGGTCLITLASGDVVNGAMKDISSPAQDVDIWSVNANLIRVGE